MVRIFAVTALLGLPMTAFAVTPVPAIQPQNVLSAVTGDWNNDGSMDRALLVGNDDGADLLVYLSDGNGNMQLASYARSFVWSGAMWGTLPALQLSSSGGLQVHAENDAIGRDRWEQTYNIALRDGKMVVSGLTATDRDTLDPKAGGNCDINFLTGKGKSNGKAVTVTGVTAVADWTQDSVPAPCQF